MDFIYAHTSRVKTVPFSIVQRKSISEHHLNYFLSLSSFWSRCALLNACTLRVGCDGSQRFRQSIFITYRNRNRSMMIVNVLACTCKLLMMESASVRWISLPIPPLQPTVSSSSFTVFAARKIKKKNKLSLIFDVSEKKAMQRERIINMFTDIDCDRIKFEFEARNRRPSEITITHSITF